MNSRRLALLAFCSMVVGLPLRAADLSRLTADVANYESGMNPQPLQQVEQLVRDAVADPARRPGLEAALMALLVRPATFEARRFACQQLAIIGTDTALSAIGELLKHDETVGIGALALSAHRSPKAAEVLRNALPDARGRTRLQLIGALGSHADAAAVGSLVRLAREPEVATANAAVAALARIGNPAARDALAALRKESRPAQAAAIADATLVMAAGLAASGDRKAATELAEEMLAPMQPLPVRRGALVTLIGFDADGGEQRIKSVLRGPDDMLKSVAIAAIPAVKTPGASARFAMELPKLTPEYQVLLLEALAAVGDAPARAALQAHVAAGDTMVRLAAIRSLGAAGDGSDVRALLGRLLQTSLLEEEAAVIEAVTRLRGGERTDQAIIAEMNRHAPRKKVQFLTVLANRSSRLGIPLWLKETATPDPAVARVAFRALGRMATANELGELVDRLASAPAAEVSADAELAVASALARIDDAEQRSAIVCDRLVRASDVEARCALLRLMSVAGGGKAIAALKVACADSDPRIADAGVRTLAEWRDATAWDPLLAIYRQPRSEQHRVLALRGLVRLTGAESAGVSPELVDRYRELLEGARNDSDRRLVLGGLARVAHPGALPLVLPLLSNPAVRAEAELAVRKIAAAIQAQHPEAAREALARLK